MQRYELETKLSFTITAQNKKQVVKELNELLHELSMLYIREPEQIEKLQERIRNLNMHLVAYTSIKEYTKVKKLPF